MIHIFSGDRIRWDLHFLSCGWITIIVLFIEQNDLKNITPNVPEHLAVVTKRNAICLVKFKSHHGQIWRGAAQNIHDYLSSQCESLSVECRFVLAAIPFINFNHRWQQLLLHLHIQKLRYRCLQVIPRQLFFSSAWKAELNIVCRPLIGKESTIMT